MSIPVCENVLSKIREFTQKAKKKTYWDLSYEILPPEITKTLEIPILRILWGLQTQCGIPLFFNIILPISESFGFYAFFLFKLVFFSYFEYISGDITRKKILRSDYHCTR